MTTVRILPEILSNQIAAGEVVQRPVSVVKELVENSIDALATSITIEVVKGGKSLIRVSDNGVGLCRDEALLSIERYATSKIFEKEDLFSISTMGFRGEALPSIASVSKFTLITRTKESDIGTKIEIIGGKIRNVSDTGAPVGTMVEVKQLFFNTPARKKFLKSDNTEISHIADAISGMALGHSHIQFRLFLNNKLQKSFSSSQDLFQRSVSILGKDTADKLYTLEFSEASIHIYGYCTNPLVTRSTSSKIFLFVNKRLVYDRGLISAIFRGYKGRVMKGRFPLGVFFIDIAFDQVDVNVHPSKKEIKFFNSQDVYQAVSGTINSALTHAQENISAYSSAPIISDAVIKEPIEKFLSFGKTRCSAQINTDRINTDQTNIDQTNKVEQSVMDWPSIPAKDIKDEVQAQAANEGYTHAIGLTSDVKIVGQVMGTYILAESKEGLFLIDQHAAHERIIYEQLKTRYDSLQVQSQNLVVPETLELNFKEADFLLSILDDLKAFGFIIEPFGETTYIVKSVPSIMDAKETTPVIIEIIETAMIKKNRFSKEDWLERCLILMACHGAIRANLILSQIEIEKLLIDLEQCENPRHCPHGRPIMINWNKHQIEKLFKRVV
ncbi:MAG: DNA mismatch repair endonuclease MutL [Desulfobacteraceae bacterium]|nr:DNA mismatch repair endonuclease MutL [Desulfobacteraceae bacterium]